jgi:hypothetical protein
MQIFLFNESYIRDREEVQISSTKTPNSQTQFSKGNLPIYTTQNQEHNYLLCFILKERK